jgi:hypothetical protein
MSSFPRSYKLKFKTVRELRRDEGRARENRWTRDEGRKWEETKRGRWEETKRGRWEKAKSRGTSLVKFAALVPGGNFTG